MAKSEYKNFDKETAEEIKVQRENNDIADFSEYVAFDDVDSRIDEIYEDVDEIIDLVEDYDVKEALQKLKELKNKLY